MRELNNQEIQNVSGGSLTSLILDFFKQLSAGPSEEKTEWTRPEGIPEANPINGTAFGMGIVSVVAAIAFGLFAL